jgi:hypothetical protein
MRAAFFLCCLGIAAGRMPTLDELPADKTKLMFPGAPTACADGTAFSFLVRKGTDPNRVLVDYMGGGACWNARCLDQESTQFQTGNGFWSLLDGISTFPSGLMQPPPGFSSTVADLKTWTYIFVPYCTQDIHLGTCTKTYVNDKGECRKVRHNGAANIKSVRDWIYQNFPAPKSLAFIGCSAGAAAVPYMEAARASTMYAGKNVSVAAVGDSPTNLLTEPFVREGLLQWGIEDSIKDVTGWSDVGPYLKADMIEKALSSIFTKHPKVQFGIYTRTEDSTQLKFYRLQGGMVASTLSDEDATKVWRRQNLNMLERLQSSHANFRAFIATGTQHCGMTFDQPLEIDASLRDPFKNVRVHCRCACEYVVSKHGLRVCRLVYVGACACEYVAACTLSVGRHCAWALDLCAELMNGSNTTDPQPTTHNPLIPTAKP